MGAMAISESKQADGKTKTLGLVAGDGKLPALLAQSAAERGYRVVALALSEDAQARVMAHADRHFLIAPGQLGRNLKLLKTNGCAEVVFIGKVPKLNLLAQLHKVDWMAIKELSTLPDFNDDTMQRKMGDIMENHGLKVLTQSEFLRHLFPEVGVITKRQPTAAEYADIEYGLKVAKELARLEIGQTVAVKDRMVIAIEAAEGTDEAIKRAVVLARGPVVVAKVARPVQDQRFDIPTVGMSTLAAMRTEKGGGCLAVEAHETMVVDKDEMASYADEHGICITAMTLKDPGA